MIGIDIVYIKLLIANFMIIKYPPLQKPHSKVRKAVLIGTAFFYCKFERKNEYGQLE